MLLPTLPRVRTHANQEQLILASRLLSTGHSASLIAHIQQDSGLRSTPSGQIFLKSSAAGRAAENTTPELVLAQNPGAIHPWAQDPSYILLHIQITQLVEHLSIGWQSPFPEDVDRILRKRGMRWDGCRVPEVYQCWGHPCCSFHGSLRGWLVPRPRVASRCGERRLSLLRRCWGCVWRQSGLP